MSKSIEELEGRFCALADENLDLRHRLLALESWLLPAERYLRKMVKVAERDEICSRLCWEHAQKERLGEVAEPANKPH